MTADILFKMLMGHFVGDYLLQTTNMALKKKTHFGWASLHCFIWTITIYCCLFSEINNASSCACGAGWPIWMTLGLIWLSHMLLDYGWGTKFGLIDVWLHLIGSRSFDRAAKYCDPKNPVPELHKSFMVTYTALVQTVADNTCHLILLYLILRAAL